MVFCVELALNHSFHCLPSDTPLALGFASVFFFPKHFSTYHMIHQNHTANAFEMGTPGVASKFLQKQLALPERSLLVIESASPSIVDRY